MKLFSKLYNQVFTWAQHKHAPYYLGALSFAESSFFPIPPDVMLVPMAIAKREKAWQFALLTTIASVIGGIVGYFIGALFFYLIQPWIQHLGYMPTYQLAESWFQQYGIWIILVAGFSPIPYKLFTIAAGALHMALLPFILMSCIARAARFFLVAGLAYAFGKPIEKFMQQYVDRIGWAVVVVILIYWMIKHNT